MRIVCNLLVNDRNPTGSRMEPGTRCSLQRMGCKCSNKFNLAGRGLRTECSHSNSSRKSDSSACPRQAAQVVDRQSAVLGVEIAWHCRMAYERFTFENLRYTWLDDIDSCIFYAHVGVDSSTPMSLTPIDETNLRTFSSASRIRGFTSRDTGGSETGPIMPSCSKQRPRTPSEFDAKGER